MHSSKFFTIMKLLFLTDQNSDSFMIFSPLDNSSFGRDYSFLKMELVMKVIYYGENRSCCDCFCYDCCLMSLVLLLLLLVLLLSLSLSVPLGSLVFINMKRTSIAA